MRKYLLGGKGKFYKANLHIHTTISDGQLTPEEVKRIYMKKGYSILAYTDHEVIVPHNDLSEENFLAITAYEASINAPLVDIEKHRAQFFIAYHFNFYSKDKNNRISPCFNERCIWLEKSKQYVTDEMRKVVYPIEYTTECVNDILQKAKEHNFLVALNHPVWSLLSYTDYINLNGIWGVEVYNTGADFEGLIDTDMPYIDLLKAGNNVVPIAADDMHTRSYAFHSFTMIESKDLTYDNVLTAMENGDLYSSTGPLIEEIYIENNKLQVKCSKVVKISLHSERRWGMVICGKDLTEAVFDLSSYMEGVEVGREAGRKVFFLRLTIIDANGNKAWTRAYFPPEWE